MREHREGKDGHQSEGRRVPRRRRASNENLPRRKNQERVSGRKSSTGRSAESWFHFKSGQT